MLICAQSAAGQDGFPAAEVIDLGRIAVPKIWVDPDGCEHFVMRDGQRGYMTPHRTRQGIPVCPYRRNARIYGEVTNKILPGRDYKAGVWVDPDGCEHWVMDDGREGYMTPHVDRNGVPVCQRGNSCGTSNDSVYFPRGSASLGARNQAWLHDFFRKTRARAYVIIGHTDDYASDAANLALSVKRANVVASIASTAGVRIADVRGYGETSPGTPNTTAAGRAQNRRVEILCIR